MPHTPPHTRLSKITAEEGQTFTEYALLVSLVAILVMVALPALATSLQSVFTAVAAAL